MRYQFERSQLRPERAPSRSVGGSAELTSQLASELGDGTVLAQRYRLQRQLHDGEQAHLCAAQDLQTGHLVALKVLKLARQATPENVGQFVREAEFGCRVEHEHVVRVRDLTGTAGGRLIMVMELLHGEDLGRTMKRRGRMRWARARAIMLDLCAALTAIHDAGIVHCGLEPSNCFRVTGRGPACVKVLDFGAAQRPGVRGCEPLQLAGSGGRLDFNPAYASPELAAGEAIDYRSDIYALGVLLGVLLTGRTPYTGATASRVLMRNIYDPVPSLASLAPPGTHIDQGLESIYRCALAKDPHQRFDSAAAFAKALVEFAREP